DVHRIYIGTDAGVYASSDGGASWWRFRSGMPNAIVTSLTLRPGLNILAAGTYGRGLLETTLEDSIHVQAKVAMLNEGSSLANAVVATISGQGAAGSDTAEIDWGDGTSSVGQIQAAGPGTYGVIGSHMFAEGGVYSLVVRVKGSAGAAGEDGAALTVRDKPLTAGFVPFRPLQYLQFSGVVARFTDADPTGHVEDYSATIDWGDRSTSAGTLTAEPGGGFAVSGSHSYFAVSKAVAISVTINDRGGATTTVKGTVSVIGSALKAAIRPIHA